MLFWIGGSFVGWGIVTVQNDVTWNNFTPPPQGYGDGILILNSAKLTIAGITLQFNSNSRITLTEGASIILSGCTLQTQSGVTQWRGIEAFGNSFIEQFDVFPTIDQPGTTSDWAGVLNPFQTFVKITNSTLIRDAQFGVESLGGAIVQSESNSRFFECEKGIWIKPYESALNPNLNACHFMNTTFSWSEAGNLMGIHLQGVNGVRIGGCNFENFSSQPYCENERGTGIFAEDAIFSATTSGVRIYYKEGTMCPYNCNGNSLGPGNFFFDLSVGIKVIGVTKQPAFDVRENIFFFNLSSIVAENTNGAVIAENFIEILRPHMNSIFKTGDNCSYTNDYHINCINIKQSKNFIVYQNNILYSANSISGTSDLPKNLTSILVDNSSGKGEIKRNTIRCFHRDPIESSYVNGIQCKGQNEDVRLFCNIFTNQGIDIKIDPGATVGSFAKSPGNVPESNGNKFSRRQSGRIRVDNRTNNSIDVWYANFDDNEDPRVTSFTEGQLRIDPYDKPDSWIACEEDCPAPLSYISKLNSDAFNFVVYPNPNSGVVFFKMDKQHKSSSLMRLEILNANGQVIFDKTVQNTSELEGLSVEGLENGLYIVYLSSPEFFIHKKLIVSK